MRAEHLVSRYIEHVLCGIEGFLTDIERPPQLHDAHVSLCHQEHSLEVFALPDNDVVGQIKSQLGHAREVARERVIERHQEGVALELLAIDMQQDLTPKHISQTGQNVLFVEHGRVRQVVIIEEPHFLLQFR